MIGFDTRRVIGRVHFNRLTYITSVRFALFHLFSSGERYAVFETATRNTGVSMVGKNKANPVSMIKASTAMLNYLGEYLDQVFSYFYVRRLFFQRSYLVVGLSLSGFVSLYIRFYQSVCPNDNAPIQW